MDSDLIDKDNDNLAIKTINTSTSLLKASRYDKVHDYCKYGYIVCQNHKGDPILAVSDSKLLAKLHNTKEPGTTPYFIKDKDFHSLLATSFSRYNASKARYYLGFMSPTSAAKNVKYGRVVFFALLCLCAFFAHATFAFHLLNNLLYFAQNLFKSMLFILAMLNKKNHTVLLHDSENEEICASFDASTANAGVHIKTSRNLVSCMDPRFREGDAEISHTIKSDPGSNDDYTNFKNARSYPIYTILLPIYKEERVAHLLIQAIGGMIYPKSKLDVKIVVEEDDILTLRSLKAIVLPDYMHIIKVPPSYPRTKPKALNYAMQYAKGEYIVIYDAEDRPEPDQLLKALKKFSELPDQYVCLQAKLNYYNRDENLLTKLFSMEYSLLFDFLLKGLEHLRLPMPLGGTSNHFKASILKDIGSWDAYNVTEDADLGIRLSLKGYKTAVLDSYTMEESPIKLASWIKQRSRWIKGFIQTFIIYLQHHRNSGITLNFMEKASIWIFIGLSTYAFLLLPWLIVTIPILNSEFLIILLLINTSFAFAYMYGVALMILKALNSPLKSPRQNAAAFLLWPFYFTLHTVASYRALFELVTQPFKWNKTEHGVSSKVTDQR